MLSAKHKKQIRGMTDKELISFHNVLQFSRQTIKSGLFIGDAAEIAEKFTVVCSELFKRGMLKTETRTEKPYLLLVAREN